MKMGKKIGSVLLSSALLLGLAHGALADTKNSNGVNRTQQVKALSSTVSMKKLKKSQWKQKRDSYDPNLRSTLGKLIHNDGKPIENDVLTPDVNQPESDQSNLFAIFKETVNGEDHEKYYFANKDSLTSEDLADIENDANTEKTKNSISALSNTVHIMSAPSGGTYKFYSWKFYTTGGDILATYSSNNQFVRETNNADINGKTGSVWDVHAFNSLESSAKFGSQTTRMEVNYSAEKLYSYGPSSDAGFTVPVSLSSITSPKDWAFEVGSVSVNDQSSISNKYGRWTYAPVGYAPSPFNTEPGIRATNTSGNFVCELSHTFTYAAGVGNHATGVISVILSDR